MDNTTIFAVAAADTRAAGTACRDNFAAVYVDTIANSCFAAADTRAAIASVRGDFAAGYFDTKTCSVVTSADSCAIFAAGCVNLAV